VFGIAVLGHRGSHRDLVAAMIGAEDVPGERAESGASGSLLITNDRGFGCDPRRITANLDVVGERFDAV